MVCLFVIVLCYGRKAQNENKDAIAPPFDLCEGKYKTDLQVAPRVLLVERAPSSSSPSSSASSPSLMISVEDVSHVASRRIYEHVSHSLQTIQQHVSGFQFFLVYPVRSQLTVKLPANDTAQANNIREHVTANILPAIRKIIADHPFNADKPEPGFVVTIDPQLGFARTDVVSLFEPLAYNVTDVFCGSPTTFYVTPKYVQGCWSNIVSHLVCAVNNCEYSLASWYFVQLQKLFQKFPVAWLSLFPSLSHLLAEYLLLCFPRSITYTLLYQHLALVTVTPTGSEQKDQRFWFVVDVLRAFTPPVLYDQAMSLSVRCTESDAVEM
jgi:hypothetical protein